MRHTRKLDEHVSDIFKVLLICCTSESRQIPKALDVDRLWCQWKFKAFRNETKAKSHIWAAITVRIMIALPGQQALDSVQRNFGITFCREIISACSLWTPTGTNMVITNQIQPNIKAYYMPWQIRLYFCNWTQFFLFIYFLNNITIKSNTALQYWVSWEHAVVPNVVSNGGICIFVAVCCARRACWPDSTPRATINTGQNMVWWQSWMNTGQHATSRSAWGGGRWWRWWWRKAWGCTGSETPFLCVCVCVIKRLLIIRVGLCCIIWGSLSLR